MNWNLENIYKTKNEFYEDEKNLISKLNKIGEYKGKLSESSSNLFNCFKLYEEALEIYSKYYAYGMLNYHLNMADDDKVRLFKKVESVEAKFEKAIAYITPEVTRIENKTLLSFFNEDTRLNKYKRKIKEILKGKNHIL